MDYKAIGFRIRALRKRRRWTQAELARWIGKSTSFLGHIERGTRIPSLETYVRIANILDVTLDMLILGDFDPFAIPSAGDLVAHTLRQLTRVLHAHTDEWFPST